MDEEADQQSSRAELPKRKGRGGCFVPYVPTPEEIAAECAKIRNEWSAAELRLRITGSSLKSWTKRQM